MNPVTLLSEIPLLAQMNRKFLFLMVGLLFCTASLKAQNPGNDGPVIYFNNGTLQILSTSKPMLYILADSLLSNPQFTVHIRGHVCCKNRNRFAKKRAKIVYQELLRMGVPKEQLTYEGYANKIPLIYPEKNPADEEKNMRVDFVYGK